METILSSVVLAALITEVWEKLFLYLVQVNSIIGPVIADSTKTGFIFIELQLDV